MSRASRGILVKKIWGWGAAAAAVMLVAGTVTAAYAAPITTDGPLTRIDISPELNCAVSYVGDSQPEFYGDTACATFVAYGGTLYGPTTIPAGGSASPRTPWTPVSQTNSGSGTAADPYTITTVVTGGSLSVTQVDTYTTGENSYRTSISVTNGLGEPVDAIVYHAADCYLQNSDYGYGDHDAATGAITCRAPDESGQPSPESRIEQFVPLSAGSNFLYAYYSAVWRAVGTQLPLPDEVVDGASSIDNGIALSWSATIPASGTSTYSLLTNFSPIGLTSLPTTLTVDPTSVATGGETLVSATVSNPNITAQSLAPLTAPVARGGCRGSKLRQGW